MKFKVTRNRYLIQKTIVEVETQDGDQSPVSLVEAMDASALAWEDTGSIALSSDCEIVPEVELPVEPEPEPEPELPL